MIKLLYVHYLHMHIVAAEFQMIDSFDRDERVRDVDRSLAVLAKQVPDQRFFD